MAQVDPPIYLPFLFTKRHRVKLGQFLLTFAYQDLFPFLNLKKFIFLRNQQFNQHEKKEIL